MLWPCEWCTPLRRTFSRFPSGWIGGALLLLRVVVGAITIAEAAAFLAGSHSPLTLLTAACAAAGGVALLFGFLTPIVSALIAAEGATLLLSFPAPGLQLLDSRMALFQFVIMAAVLAILGPGSTSVDARLFGLREVAISGKRRPGDSPGER
jgi:uncharacterized membrane protein YphA (DoxX/SURF4 family)